MKIVARIIFFVSLLALVTAPLFAQTKQSADTPPDVSFTIRFKSGKSSFYQGELITIEMLFSSTSPDRYKLSGANYDRSGRFLDDTFHVEPSTGIVDPTAEYFRSVVFGFAGGGLFPWPITLGEQPYVIPRDINELVRFDEPGHYRLYVTNSRITIGTASRTQKPTLISTTSNTIEFDILPRDPKWEQKTIRDAAQAIRDKGDQARDACRALRFMNSAAAEAEMIRLFPSGCAGEFNLGLVGSPRRRALIEAMETQIAAPDYPVTSGFMHTLSAITFMNENSEPPMAYPTGEPEKIKVFQALAQKRRDAFQEVLTRYSRQIAASVSRKTRAARAASLDTLLQFDVSKPNEADATGSQLLASLPDLFLDLSPERQYALLGFYWTRIANPAMLPALRQLVAKPPTIANTFTDLRTVALKRLYQLAPDEGREIILREIKLKWRHVATTVLEILPDAELAEVDEMIADGLDKSSPDREFDVLAQNADLIRRYASANILPQVKKSTADRIGKMSCDAQGSLLTYFLRVDPDFGAASFEQALQARGKDAPECYQSAFESVGRRFMSPELENIALAHIDDRDRVVAEQAVVLLRQKGSVKAKKALLDRLARWHTEWKARPADVQPESENAVVNGDPAQFEAELVRALVSATTWTLDAHELDDIGQLTFTQASRTVIELARKALDDHTIHIEMNGDDDPFFRIHLGNYYAGSLSQLKQKLATMPKGTHFVWHPLAFADEADARRFREIKNFLTEKGMTLERSEK